MVANKLAWNLEGLDEALAQAQALALAQDKALALTPASTKSCSSRTCKVCH